MAAVYTNVTIAGATKEAIIVDGTGATERVILKESLSPYDQKQMDIVSDSAGADFAAKLAATTLSNGLLASDVYANFIVNTQAYSERVERANYDAIAKDADQDLELADHETRIAALEAAP